MQETLIVLVIFVVFVGSLFLYRGILENIQDTAFFKNPHLKFILLVGVSALFGLVLFFISRILINVD